MTPEELNFSHTIGEVLPASQNIDVIYGGEFALLVPGHLVLSGGNLVDNGVAGGVRQYTGKWFSNR